MSEKQNPAFSALFALTFGHTDVIARIAAPLWARVGRPVEESELSWARAILGEGGPRLLVEALMGFDALGLQTKSLSARGVSRFLSALVGDFIQGDAHPPGPIPELVWTLPHVHAARSIRGQTYFDCCLRLIHAATESLTLVSPLIDLAGIGMLSGPLLEALARNVSVRLFVHDALNIGTPTSQALEELRRQAVRANVDLSVFSAEAGAGRDRRFNPLFHAKLIIQDVHALLLGSANLTSYALSSNFEAGVLLGEESAGEVLFVLEGILHSNTVYLVFSTKSTA